MCNTYLELLTIQEENRKLKDENAALVKRNTDLEWENYKYKEIMEGIVYDIENLAFHNEWWHID